MEMPFCFLVVGKVAMQLHRCLARSHHQKGEDNRCRKRIAQSLFSCFFLSSAQVVFLCFSECAFCVGHASPERKKAAAFVSFVTPASAFCICCGLIHISYFFLSLSLSLAHPFLRFSQRRRQFCFLLCALIISWLFYTPPLGI
jgi:hypothetical protein